VDAAGTRARQGTVNSAGTWEPKRGKKAETETFRPGKTARQRRGGRS